MALHVILGRAGMGKSTLAHMVGANHIRDGGTVLYMTALVETHQTLISQARTFPFFDPSCSSSPSGFVRRSAGPRSRGRQCARGESRAIARR